MPQQQPQVLPLARDSTARYSRSQVRHPIPDQACTEWNTSGRGRRSPQHTNTAERVRVRC